MRGVINVRDASQRTYLMTNTDIKIKLSISVVIGHITLSNSPPHSPLNSPDIIVFAVTCTIQVCIYSVCVSQ
jgi:hypothetical protein